LGIGDGAVEVSNIEKHSGDIDKRKTPIPLLMLIFISKKLKKPR
jgi:hypothetical protein